MKKDIHPQYQEAQVSCGCGNAFTTRSTKDKIAVEVCSNCHPFYTGKQKFVDTAGMVERFQKKWKGEAAQKAHAIANPPPKKSALLRAQLARQQQTIAATLGAPKPAATPAAAAAKPASPAPAPAATPAATAAPAKIEPPKKA